MPNIEVEITGTVIKKSEKQEQPNYEWIPIIVKTDDENYPQSYPIDMQKNTFGYLDNVQEGDKVKITANLKGRLWTSPQQEEKAFVSLSGYKVTKTS